VLVTRDTVQGATNNVSRAGGVDDAGRYVAFESLATDLVPNDTNGSRDVFRRDTTTGQTVLVSAKLGAPGVGGNGASGGNALTGVLVDIDSSGSRVVFGSSASDLVSQDTNGVQDVFLRDVSTSTTTRLNLGPANAQPTAPARDPRISRDGNVVVFYSEAPLDGASAGIYARNVTTGALQLVVADPTPGGTDLLSEALDDDGSVVAVTTTLPLVAGDTNGLSDVYVVDRTAGTVERVSVRADGSQLMHASNSPDVSGDGRLVVYQSASPNLVTGDTNANFDVFLHDRVTDSVSRVSVPSDPSEEMKLSFSPVISGDGRIVGFISSGTESAGATRQVYARDVALGTTDLISVASNGAEANGATELPGIDDDGRALVYNSLATNLVPPDGNGTTKDIFLARLDHPPVVPAAISGLTLTATPTLPENVAAVPIANIPASAIPASAVDLVAATDLRDVSPDAAVLSDIRLRNIRLRNIAGDLADAGAVLLSEAPLQLPGGWSALLAGTALAGVPPQNLTIDDVLALDPPPAGLDQISLADVDLSETTLRSASFVSLAVGGDTTLADLSPTHDWCGLLAAQGLSCAQLGIDLGDADTTNDGNLLVLDLAGASVEALGLETVRLRNIDLSASDLQNTRLRNIDMEVSRLRNIRLRNIDMDVSRLRNIRLRNIDIAATRLRNIPISDAPGIVTGPCPGCQTLGDAADAGAIDANATLGDLVGVVPASTDLGLLGELLQALFDPDAEDLGTLAELLETLLDPDDSDLGSLAELILSLFVGPDFPWEDLPLDEMDITRFAEDPTVAFTVQWTTTGNTPVGGTTVTVQIPDEFTFQPGSATRNGSPIADPAVNGSTLTFQGSFAQPGAITTIAFEATTGLDPGPASASTQVTVAGTVGNAAANASLDVQEALETGDDIASSIPIEPDVLYLPRMSRADDLDFFSFGAPPTGSRLNVRLSDLGFDGDLVLYTDTDTGTESARLRNIRLRNIPVDDLEVSEEGATEAAPPETLDDLPIQPLRLRNISANRGASDEGVEAVSQSEGDTYTIQVSGYNSATSTDPYVLRLEVNDPPAAPECAPRTFPFPDGTAGQSSAIPADVGTVILYNQRRTARTHGDAAAAAVRAEIDEFAALVNGHVLAVDADQTASSLYQTWDADPCDAQAADAVAQHLSGLVVDLAEAHPTIEHVLIVGGDDLVPSGRQRDDTKIANESTYAGEIGDPNALVGAAAAKTFLSDDLYGDLDPIGWLDQTLYVPELAVGRLAGDTDDWLAALDAFGVSGGVLDPSTADTAFTTGYDFLADGADEVDAALGDVKTNRSLLNTEDWTKQDLLDALFPVTGDSPEIASVNAHYDHHRALPAAGNTTDDDTDLYETDDVVAGALDGALLFTMGCHAGLNVPDAYLPSGDPLAADWADTLARSVYVANTGYGYGETDIVALSERLMADFAGGLSDHSVGRAHAAAKQLYFGQSGIYGAYDHKVMQQSVLYGIPNYVVEGSSAQQIQLQALPAALAAAPEPDPATGLQAANVEFAPSGFDQDDTDDGTVFTTPGGGLEVENGRPVIPTLTQDVTADALFARGAILTGATWEEHADINPKYARATIDLSANEPEIEHPGPFPSYFLNLERSGIRGEEADNLTALLGQFIPDEGSTSGTMMLFTDMQARVFYGDAESESVKPEFLNVAGESDGEFQSFTVDVVDRTELGQEPPAGEVVYVSALVAGGDGIWREVPLVQVPGTNTWVGQAPVIGGSSGWFLQAVDAAGNTAVTTNKTFFFAPTIVGDVGEFTTAFSGTPGNAPFFRSDGLLTVTGPATYQASVDEGPLQAVPPTGLPISGDGEHTIAIVGSDGSGGTTSISIDSTPPTIQITVPADGATFQLGQQVAASFTCDDALSGVATCTGPPTVATGQAGTFDFTVDASDNAGNTATAQSSYTVLAPAGLTFVGFFPPVRNYPGPQNVVDAGNPVLFTWDVFDSQGERVTSLSVVQSLTSQRVNCSNPTQTIGGPRNERTSGLLFTFFGRYVFKWFTRGSWENTCRMFTLTLTDGVPHQALFRFTD
jgi:uncharacterized repeat protein (TIGR01451 family)